MFLVQHTKWCFSCLTAKIFFLLTVGYYWPWSWPIKKIKKKLWWFCHVAQVISKSFILFRMSWALRSCVLVQMLLRHMVRNSQGCWLWSSHKNYPPKKRRKRSSVTILIVDGSHFLSLKLKAAPTNPFCKMPTAHGNHHIIILQW